MGGLNIAAFINGGFGGYQAVKNLQGQEDERLRKKNQDVRDDVKAGREDKAYGDEQAYKQDLQTSINQWKDANGLGGSPQAQPPILPSGPSVAAASGVMPQAPQTAPAQPATPMAAGITAPQSQPQTSAQPPRPNANQMLDLKMRIAFSGLKHGKPEGVFELQQTMEKMRDEGFDKTLQMLKQPGNEQAAFDYFNSLGKEKREFVSAKDGIYVTPTGDKIPTRLVTARSADGTTTVLDTAQMEFQLMKAKDLVEMSQKSRKVGAEEVSAKAKAANGGGGITLPQQRTNYEIESARKHIAGLSPEEIQKRTQQYSATGRDNPDYDPLLAAKVRQANRRKYGIDPYFDTSSDKQATETQPDITARFTADPAMKGHRIGNKTPQGVEVLDASGKLVGHYN